MCVFAGFMLAQSPGCALNLHPWSVCVWAVPRVCLHAVVLWAANPLIQSAAVQALMWLHYHMHLKSSSCEPMQHAKQRWNLVKEIGNWICLISWWGRPTGPSSARLTIRLICWLCVGSCNSPWVPLKLPSTIYPKKKKTYIYIKLDEKWKIFLVMVNQHPGMLFCKTLSKCATLL